MMNQKRTDDLDDMGRAALRRELRKTLAVEPTDGQLRTDELRRAIRRLRQRPAGGQRLVTDGGRAASDAGILQEVPTGRDTAHVALVSGGMDSTVAAARAAEVAPKLDFVAYLDTGTGLDANEEYVKELADALGVQLWTLRTHVDYEERVEEHGFPGPSRHSIMYRSLKERQIGKLATVTGEQELVLWTGVRSDESERRMAHVERVQEVDRWTWVAPIHDWSKGDCLEYLDANELPRNDLWSTLGRSGDCFCGVLREPRRTP